MCHKAGYAQTTAVENMSEFNEALKDNLDDSLGSAAAAFGGKSVPRLSIGCLILDWNSNPEGIITLMKKIKDNFSGRFGIMLLAPGDMGSKFLMASKAGAHTFLIKPFKQEDFKKKLKMAMQMKSEPIIQSFNIGSAASKSKQQGFGENPFTMAPTEEKKKVLTAI